jgi:hypothetical protein
VSGDAVAVMFVRLRRGVVGETQRVVHVVPIQDANAIPDVLQTYCRRVIRPGTADLLSEPRGMPCEYCLASIPLPGTEASVIEEI